MGRRKGGDREIWWVNRRGFIEGRVYRDGICQVVKQHRRLLEQHLGRRLYPAEIVHHINGNRQDNRIENLEIKTKGEHSKHHNLIRIYPKGRKNKLSLEERKRRSDFMKEVHRRRQENDPTNRWYARTQDAR